MYFGYERESECARFGHSAERRSYLCAPAQHQLYSPYILYTRLCLLLLNVMTLLRRIYSKINPQYPWSIISSLSIMLAIQLLLFFLFIWVYISPFILRQVNVLAMLKTCTYQSNSRTRKHVSCAIMYMTFYAIGQIKISTIVN